MGKRVFLSSTKLLFVPFSSVIFRSYSPPFLSFSPSTSPSFSDSSCYSSLQFLFFEILRRNNFSNPGPQPVHALHRRQHRSAENLRESSAKTVESTAAGRSIFLKNILFKFIDVILRRSFC